MSRALTESPWLGSPSFRFRGSASEFAVRLNVPARLVRGIFCKVDTEWRTNRPIYELSLGSYSELRMFAKRLPSAHRRSILSRIIPDWNASRLSSHALAAVAAQKQPVTMRPQDRLLELIEGVAVERPVLLAFFLFEEKGFGRAALARARRRYDATMRSGWEGVRRILAQRLAAVPVADGEFLSRGNMWTHTSPKPAFPSWRSSILWVLSREDFDLDAILRFASPGNPARFYRVLDSHINRRKGLPAKLREWAAL